MEYIFGQCELALQNLQTDSNSGALSLKSLETAVVKQVEEIHNEVRSLHRKCYSWILTGAVRWHVLSSSQGIALYKFVSCFLFPIYLFTVIGINFDLIIAFP